MAPRKPKAEPVITLKVPPPVEGIDRWLIMGLDPSVTRTGYAFMLVENSVERSAARWMEVGSLAPDDTNDPVWIRSKAVALAVRDKLKKLLTEQLSGADLSRTGLIISFEAPTPQNDFLISISRILHLVLLEENGPAHSFARVNVQLTNAATLRRLMGLTQRGSSNKKENVAKAYTFLDQGSYPNLDTDACDAVLMGMMARYSAAILMGYPNTIPERFLIAPTDGTEEVKGKGNNTKIRTKGILHRPEYWTLYERKHYAVVLRDARIKKARLDRQKFFTHIYRFRTNRTVLALVQSMH